MIERFFIVFPFAYSFIFTPINESYAKVFLGQRIDFSILGI